MRTPNYIKRNRALAGPQAGRSPVGSVARSGCQLLVWIIGITLFCLPGRVVHATGPDPGSPPPWLDYWSFGDTNSWHSDLNYAPISFTNLSSSLLGDGTALVVDSTNAAWLRYKVTEANGTNNLRVDRGSVMFWFAPDWSGTNAGGRGPGQ